MPIKHFFFCLNINSLTSYLRTIHNLRRNHKAIRNNTLCYETINHLTIFSRRLTHSHVRQGCLFNKHIFKIKVICRFNIIKNRYPIITSCNHVILMIIINGQAINRHRTINLTNHHTQITASYRKITQ